MPGSNPADPPSRSRAAQLTVGFPSATGDPIERVRGLYRGDRIAFEAHLTQ